MERSVAELGAGRFFFFGGTFDPPHHGHYAIVRHMLESDAAARVLVMPAAGAPLRSDKRLFSYRQRFALTRGLFKNEIAAGRVILSVLEHRLPKPNYTFDTLAALERICGQKPVVVIGADQAQQLSRWHRAAELMAGYEFLVFARRGATPQTIAGLKARLVEDFAEDISATALRHELAALPAAERFRKALDSQPNK